jgi:hypothetical protein
MVRMTYSLTLPIPTSEVSVRLQSPLLHTYLVISPASHHTEELGIPCLPMEFTLCYIQPEIPGKEESLCKQDSLLLLLHG